MANPRYIQAQTFQLIGSGASAGDTSITVQSFKLPDGVTLIQTTDLGDQCYATLEPNAGTQEESIQFTGVTQNLNGTATLTGVSTVGFNYPYTVTSGLAKNHAGGVTFVLSDTAGLYGNIITYINNIAISGSPVATNTTLGLTKLSIASDTPSTPVVVGRNNTLSATVISSTNPVVDKSSLATTSTANAVVQANGSGKIDTSFLTTYNIGTVQVFTSSGTWTKPAGCTYVEVEMVGGGGGSGGIPTAGGSNYAQSSGAGAGGYCRKLINVSAISSETVTVGAAGSHGISSGANGTAGGNSSFGVLCTANGGGGSQSANGGTPGTGGTASGGDVNCPGGDGQPVSSNNIGIPGFGGVSFFGSSTAYGAGAPGAARTTGVNGNDGNGGIVIVREYYV